MDAQTSKRGPSAETPGLPVPRPEQLPPPKDRPVKDRKTGAPPPKSDDKPKPSLRDRLRETGFAVAPCLDPSGTIAVVPARELVNGLVDQVFEITA